MNFYMRTGHPSLRRENLSRERGLQGRTRKQRSFEEDCSKEINNAVAMDVILYKTMK